MYVCMHVYTCRIYIYICIYMFRVYVHTYIHTYMQALEQAKEPQALMSAVQDQSTADTPINDAEETQQARWLIQKP